MAIFEDVFEVIEIDKEEKRFDRVSRLEGRGEDHENIELSLDYHCEIYELEIGNKFELVLRNSLTLTDDTIPSEQNKEYDQTGVNTLFTSLNIFCT